MLYLISRGNERAEEILFKKYSILISKKIREFNLTDEYEDVFQECLLSLSKAVDTYMDVNVGFFSYFNTILSRKLISIIRLRKTQSKHKVVYDDLIGELRDPIDSEIYGNLKDDKIFKGLTTVEKLLVDLRYFKNWPVKKIADYYNMKEMAIYYRLKLIKEKIKKNYEELS